MTTTTSTPLAPGDRESDAKDEPVVRVRDLVKSFRRADGSVVRAVDHVSLDVYPGEFVVLLGPSGCGKTTLLRTIAGLERAESGRIEIHGRTSFSSAERISTAPEGRRLNMIFQSYALWPHMTAAKNVAYPLESLRPRLSAAEIDKRVRRVLDLVGVPELAEQYPNQMSGGQQQRVALARALVSEDGLVLFDEPLSNVDANVREQLRVELIAMQRELGFAALFVTHDQAEAMQLAHNIAVLRDGSVAQYASPRQLYDAPVNRYVANFIGSMNEFPGVVSAVDSDGVTVETELGLLRGVQRGTPVAVGDSVVALCRPERCVLGDVEPTTANRWSTSVVATMFAGPHTECILRLRDTTLRVWTTSRDPLEPGASRWVSVDPADLSVIPDEVEAN